MKEFEKFFAARLKELREDDSMTEFARRLGVPLKTYQNYEYGTRKPSLKFVIDICRKLKVDANWILGLKDSASQGVSIVGDGNAAANGDGAVASVSFESAEVERLRGEVAALERMVKVFAEKMGGAR